MLLMPLTVFSLLIPAGDGEQRTMVMWMEGRRRGRATGGGGGGGGGVDSEEGSGKPDESGGVSGEGGPNKSAAAGRDENSQPQHFPLSVSHQISCEI